MLSSDPASISAPATIAYAHPTGDLLFLTNFITASEEAALLRGLYGADYAAGTSKDKDGTGGTAIAPAPRLPWVQLSRRRLLNLGGVPGNNERPLPNNNNTTNDSGGTEAPRKISPMIPEPIPQWALEPVGRRLLEVSAAMEAKGATLRRDQQSEASSSSTADASAPPSVLVASVLASHPPTDGAMADAVVGLLAKTRRGTAASNPDGEEAHRPSLPPLTTPLYRVVSSAINHILVNEYTSSNGILGHEDGPVYEPIVSIVSLESAVMLRFESKEWRRERGEAALRASQARRSQQQQGLAVASSTDAAMGTGAPSPQQQQGEEEGDVAAPRDAIVEMFLPPRSLVVFRGSFYTEYLHSVPEVTVDTFSKAHCLNFDEAVAYAHHLAQQQGGDEVSSSPLPPSSSSVSIPRGPRRVSLTYRRVLVVSKLSAASLFGRRR